ncbi:hypothetical protein PR048_006313 [Dryococelus australis]|uniref:Uncharacterized protein n=1 Tax=Dryococelus australis TaxID=614101 RepID=A0ABQ9IAS0_9NEOP|nr:hypothetical protein PR048_006313 [Dryococelus australis]
MKSGGKREIPEKTRRPTTSSGTIPKCENTRSPCGSVHILSEGPLTTRSRARWPTHLATLVRHVADDVTWQRSIWSSDLHPPSPVLHTVGAIQRLLSELEHVSPIGKLRGCTCLKSSLPDCEVPSTTCENSRSEHVPTFRYRAFDNTAAKQELTPRTPAARARKIACRNAICQTTHGNSRTYQPAPQLVFRSNGQESPIGPIWDRLNGVPARHHLTSTPIKFTQYSVTMGTLHALRVGVNKALCVRVSVARIAPHVKLDVITLSERIWAFLNNKFLRADESEMRREWSSTEMQSRGETRGPRQNPPTSDIVRQDSHLSKSGVTLPGIEPGLSWWEESSLSSQPPRSLPAAYRLMSGCCGATGNSEGECSPAFPSERTLIKTRCGGAGTVWETCIIAPPAWQLARL